MQVEFIENWGMYLFGGVLEKNWSVKKLCIRAKSSTEKKKPRKKSKSSRKKINNDFGIYQKKGDINYGITVINNHVHNEIN